MSHSSPSRAKHAVGDRIMLRLLDEQAAAWADAQANVSASLRVLIRSFIEHHGVSDVMPVPTPVVALDESAPAINRRGLVLQVLADLDGGPVQKSRLLVELPDLSREEFDATLDELLRSEQVVRKQGMTCTWLQLPGARSVSASTDRGL